MKMTTLSQVGGAAAIALTLIAGAASAQGLQAATGPQPGDCKAHYETVIAPSAGAAQVMWGQVVAAKLGTKWAHWVGAKNKLIVPVGATQFQALAQPCFYQPVP
jgi:hypothetical protein